MKDRYITATLELLNSHKDVEVILRGLRTVLKKRGHEALYPGILRGVLRTLKDGVQTTGAKVVVAKAGDVAHRFESIKAHAGTLNAPEDLFTIVDPSIVGGYIVEYNSQRIDASFKRALASLYERITT